jgi:hypothetical protein
LHVLYAWSQSMVPPTLFKLMYFVMWSPSSNAFQISKMHFSLMNFKWRSDCKEATVKVELAYRVFGKFWWQV